ncbi:NUDIX domain-containing protein [Stenotrophomonas sp. ATCM1_4]|uniref:NUDIX hydrolase n=1 Tax=Stenotrophomonas capsici TaxID=3110230 RepID=A0ABU5V089_9GAMM|nr:MULTISPECIES: NUDIX hydrolase [unclassified Stenotrophomonas]MEA5666754.1 NUDIX hydrolase [Stenotrophomonas sp. MH1]TDB27013.1 NUDIX domain-containing protein [Stenotrophomonas sp. ATCM1_4]
MHEQDQALRQALQEYARTVPQQAEVVQSFLALLADQGPDPFCRERLAGHFTGSAWLVSADGQRVLLTHHRKLARWLQLGGHADGDHDLAAVALREAQEESGLPGLSLGSTGIYDLDRHWIPARGEVPGHWHYDVRYVVQAGADERFAVSEESLDLAWCTVHEVAGQDDASLRRMAQRWLARSTPR